MPNQHWARGNISPWPPPTSCNLGSKTSNDAMLAHVNASLIPSHGTVPQCEGGPVKNGKIHSSQVFTPSVATVSQKVQRPSDLRRPLPYA